MRFSARNFLAGFLSFLICVTLSGPLLAQSQTAMDTVVVTATRTPTPERLLGSSVTVIDREEIEQSQAVRVRGLLKSVPGVNVSGNGSFGGKTTIRMRGLDDRYTQVLVDGVRVNDPSSINNVYDISTLSTDNVQRIEIIRGPQSVMYGSDAITGVINVITRDGTPETSVRGRIETGRYDSRRVSGGVSGKSNRIRYNLHYGRWETDGISAKQPDGSDFTEKDAYENRTFSSNLSVNLADDWSLSAITRYIEARTESDGVSPTFPYDPVDDNDYQDMIQRVGKFSLGGTAFVESWHHEFAYRVMNQDRVSVDEPAGDRSHFDSERRQWSYETRYHVNDAQSVSASVSTEREQAQTPSVEEDFRNHAVAGEYQWQVWEDLVTTLGLRHDDHEEFGGHTSYRGSVAYFTEALAQFLPGRRTKFKMLYGTGFKAPTVYQLYVDNTTMFGTTTTGNPNLEPETSKGWDVGFEHFFGSDASLGITYFRTDVSDKIVFDGVPAPQPDYTNLSGESESQGLEVTVNFHPTSWLSVKGNYSYQDSEDASGDEITYIPQDKGSALATIQWNTRINLQVEGQYVGDRPASDFATQPILEEYTLWGVRGQYRLSDRTKLYGRINNLTDEDYQETDGFGTPGRNGHLGIRVKF